MKKKIVLIISITILVLGTYIMFVLIRGNNKRINICQESVSEEFLDDDNNEENVADNGSNRKNIGDLEIKRINLKGPVQEGSSPKVLKEYIGHIEGTPIYDGNVCLAAHNRGNKHSYFSRINELSEGDEIVYNTDFYSRHYKVVNIKEIDETDWEMLEDSNENKLTLITCIKNKKDKRLCVQAVQV